MADLDPQSNLTAMCLREDRIEQIYDTQPKSTIYRAIEPLKRGVGDIASADFETIAPNLYLILGDLLLSDAEEDFSSAWPQCVDRNERGFRVVSALSRIIRQAADAVGAEIILIDVGPTFGALNRAAMITADFVVIPVAPDLFSVRGLENVGTRLKTWREEWKDRLERASKIDIPLPSGCMEPLGYVVSRHTEVGDGVVRAFQKWINRIPKAYRDCVEDSPRPDAELMLGRLKDYRSLIAMAQDARKPMFLLKPADGAIGGHQKAVQAAYDDFEALARTIAERIGLVL